MASMTGLLSQMMLTIGYSGLRHGPTVMLTFIRLTVSLFSDYCHENKNMFK